MTEQLPSFVAGKVMRDGDVVLRKPRRGRTEFVRRLLGHLEDCSWRGAPRHLGYADGLERLTFMAGVAGDALGQHARSDAAIAGAATLLRELHDLTADTELAGSEEVVCHGDIGLQNTIYSPDTGLPVGFIDWESARPAGRAVDVAMLLWHFTAIDTGGDVGEAARQAGMALAAYGPIAVDTVVDYLAFRQQATLNLVEERIAAGVAPGPAWARARLDEQFRANVAWTEQNLTALRRALNSA